MISDCRGRITGNVCKGVKADSRLCAVSCYLTQCQFFQCLFLKYFPSENVFVNGLHSQLPTCIYFCAPPLSGTLSQWILVFAERKTHLHTYVSIMHHITVLHFVCFTLLWPLCDLFFLEISFGLFTIHANERRVSYSFE